MKSMIKFIAPALLAFTLSAPAMANTWNYMVCNGSDTAGQPVTLSAYSGTSVVTINGDALKIVGRTADGSGVVTERFVTKRGTVVYDSIVPVSNTNLDLYQFNAITQALLAKAALGCKFYGYNGSISNSADRDIFKTIIAK